MDDPLKEKAPAPTHVCVICSAKWLEHDDGSWSLVSEKCGSCCDNAPMSEAPIVKLNPDGIVRGDDHEQVKSAYLRKKRDEEVDRYKGLLCAICDQPFEDHHANWRCPRSVAPRFKFPDLRSLPDAGLREAAQAIVSEITLPDNGDDKWCIETEHLGDLQYRHIRALSEALSAIDTGGDDVAQTGS